VNIDSHSGNTRRQSGNFDSHSGNTGRHSGNIVRHSGNIGHQSVNIGRHSGNIGRHSVNCGHFSGNIEQIQFCRAVIPNLTLPGNPGSNLIPVTEIEIQFVFPDESRKLPRIQPRGNNFLRQLSVASFAIDHPSRGQTSLGVIQGTLGVIQ
jgi:hypothetical protein